jgi:hypothetical protein
VRSASENEDDLDVLVLKTLGAAPRHRLRGRRPKRAEPGDLDAEPVPVTRATAIAAQGFESESEAAGWLERCRTDEELREATVERALLVVNRAVHAHRIAAAEPHTQDVARTQALAVRVGYGSGEEVADGRWSACYELPPPRAGQRRQLLGSQEELARIVGGRNPARASEDMALRARLDLNQQRTAQAALQLDAALAALAIEQEAEQSSDARVTQLLDGRANIRALAETALREQLSEEQRAELSQTLLELERVMRRRRHRG